MARVLSLWSLLVLWTVAGLAAREIVDLTHPFSGETIYWPTEDGFRLKVEFEGTTEKGYYYAANSFCAAEHGGTHIDAPIHFAAGMPTVDEIELERLVASGIMINVRSSARDDPDYLISIDDVLQWEQRNGPIADGSIVLFQTGWERYYPDRKKYLGTDLRGDAAVAELHFPGLSPEAARWLVSHRNLAAVGLDTASIDRGQSATFESHQILFKAGIPVLENVASLRLLPEKGFQIVALPMKIQGGSGAPLRIIAILD